MLHVVHIAVESVLNNHRIDHKKVVSHGRWSLITPLTYVEMENGKTMCQEYEVFQPCLSKRWSRQVLLF